MSPYIAAVRTALQLVFVTAVLFAKIASEFREDGVRRFVLQAILVLQEVVTI